MFVACIGTADCRGSLKLVRGGKTVGVRDAYTLKQDDGGFVHITLNTLGKRLLRHRGTMNVKATVANALVRGQTATKTVTLVRYSTRGLRG